MTRLVGIDLGGTAVKAGALSASGERLANRSAPVDLERGADHVLDQMAELARELGVERSLGVGVPGLVDRATGRVLKSPNLQAMEMAPLTSGLAERLGLPESAVRLENDANAAALGEQRFGAGRGIDDLALLTLGTGVGGGLVLGGELYTGASGLAGEVGHVVIDPAGPRCGCGNRGCLEQLASATAVKRRALELGLPEAAPGDLILLAERSRHDAGPERELLRAVGRDLGRGIGVLVTLLDLRTVIVGGGFGAALDQLASGAREGLAETSYGERLADVRILPAGLGADAGWIGAAWLGAT